jgi:mRNA interferase MazF
LYPAEAYVMVGGAQHKAMADQITTASKQRLREKIAKLNSADVAGVERVIKTQLGLA